ncbi:MAG TPA: VWA domain-containing protein [Terriglobia bacterium]|nr:VWA domain-containing protein [Terriglobia bacterium]
MIRPALSLLVFILMQQTVLRVDVQLQQVVVSVRDDQGRLVKNLRESDFTLEENGVPQTIVHFVQDGEAPISLGILIDTSGSMAAMPSGTLTALRASVGATRLLMRLMKSGDEFLLMSFASGFSVDQVFTEDSRKIDAKLVELKPSGSTNLFPAVQRALREMKKANYPKKALIVLSDAETSGNFEQLRRDIRDSEVLIYTFAIRGLTDNLTYPSYIPPVPAQPSTISRAPVSMFAGLSMDDMSQQVLDALAGESGGQSVIFQMNSDALVERMISFVQDIAAELRGQYTIGYYPPPLKASEPQVIRVRSKAGRVRVHRELR